MPVSITSLYDVSPGKKVRIRTILFDLLREECAGLGLRAGGTVSVGMRTADHLLLEPEVDLTVMMNRDWARFIEVEVTSPVGHATRGARPDDGSSISAC